MLSNVQHTSDSVRSIIVPTSAKTGSEALGRLIKAHREALGLRRRDLVDATGLSYPYVSQIETGYRLPSDRALRDLAGALRIDVLALASTLPPDRLPASRPITQPSGGQPADWFPNATYAPDTASAPASPLPRSVPDVVHEVVILLEQLTADDRLDALAQVQRDVVRRLVAPAHKTRR